MDPFLPPPSYTLTNMLYFVLTSVGYSGEPAFVPPQPMEPPVTLAIEQPVTLAIKPQKRRVRFALEEECSISELEEACSQGNHNHNPASSANSGPTTEEPPYALNTSPICVFFRRNAGIVVCRVDSADPVCEVVKRNGKIVARVRRNPPAVVRLV